MFSHTYSGYKIVTMIQLANCVHCPWLMSRMVIVPVSFVMVCIIHWITVALAVHVHLAMHVSLSQSTQKGSFRPGFYFLFVRNGSDFHASSNVFTSRYAELLVAACEYMRRGMKSRPNGIRALWGAPGYDSILHSHF